MNFGTSKANGPLPRPQSWKTWWALAGLTSLFLGALVPAQDPDPIPEEEIPEEQLEPAQEIDVPPAEATPIQVLPTPTTARPIPTRIRPVTSPNAPGGAFPPRTSPIPGQPGSLPPGGLPVPSSDGEGTGEASLSPEEVAQIPDDELVTLNLPNAPLETALDLYASLVRRVLLRPPQLAGGPINLKFEDLTRLEAIDAMNAVLALNGISVIPVGAKFVKVVPSQQAVQEGAQTSSLALDEMSELGQFVTKLVKVSEIKPGDIAQAVQQFASGKVQNPVLVFDDQNFFILRDMSANVKRMTELIQELDVTPELDYKLEVIPIRYGKVDEIYETLSSVITGSGGGGGASRATTRSQGFRSGTTGTTGTGLPGSVTPQQTLGRTGTTGTAMTSPGAARSTFAQRLSQVTAAATGGGQYSLLEDARIIPDMRSNSLIVYAGREDFVMLTNIVAKIDTLLAQVLIESIILEVSLEKGEDFGVSMVQNPQNWGNWTTRGASLNKTEVSTNILNAIFQNGFSYLGQYKDDFAVALTAVARDSGARVLARPRIQTTHAQPASFEIGDTVPYPRSSSPAYGGVGGGFTPFTTYDEKRVTTKLDVTPFITPDGLVTLEVIQVIDQLGPTTTIGQDEIPTIRTRSANAVLSVRDREPVILGGFITDRATDSTSGVPWLKDIPLIGWAFRSKSDFSQRSELIVLIRPTILTTPQEASELAQLERSTLPNAAAAVREFQAKEAEMAERLGVLPGSTNALPEPETKSSRRSRRSRN